MSLDGVVVSVYERLYPVAVLLCAAAGVACYAVGEPVMAMESFLAVALGLKLDDSLRSHWDRKAEAEASRGWARARLPV